MAETKRQAAEKQKQAAEAERRRQEEAAAHRRAAEERQRQEDARRQAEADRQAAEAQAREGALQAAMEAEQRGRELDYFRRVIHQKIRRNWLIPSNTQNLRCTLRVRLAPGGEVIEVRVIEGSGSPMFDDSAQKAVLRAAPLPVPKRPVRRGVPDPDPGIRSHQGL